MRLDTTLDNIKGVGSKTFEALKSSGLTTVEDFIETYPRAYDDYSVVSNIKDLSPGKVVIRAYCESVSTRIVRRGMRITTATLADESGKVRAIWFNQPYRETQLKSEKQFIVSGEFGLSRDQYQITNPSVEQAEESLGLGSPELIVPIYRSVKGIKPKIYRTIIDNLRPILSFLPETLPEQIVKRQKLLSRAEAFQKVHFPASQSDITESKERLAFEELFGMLLSAQLNKSEQTKLKGWQIKFNQPTIKQFVDSLPYQLTKSQRVVAWQILQDFEKDYPMNRLLQGDVGSGKTVVAGLVARQVAQAGLQTAIMAPTEILATQHAETLESILSQFGVRIGLLTGNVKGKARQLLLDRLSSGELDIIVGTHALIQKGIDYHNLGLVVIDEQHRFGVKQRQVLLEKSDKMPHLLSMTATPIPRSLALTLYGELDISILNELPAGRKPIETKIFSPASRLELYVRIESQLMLGRQVYVVCPLIDNNPDNDKASVEAEYHMLSRTVFSKYKVGLLHGRLSSTDKDGIMKQFIDGAISILVSTTVIEVGVNVPNATVMLIENADHYGLSQLHQLRGRVGRGSHQSYCYLMMSNHDKPSVRLREVEKSQDGFHLAEVDLETRGPGEIYGRSQHGTLNLKVANLGDTKLIARAQGEAARFVAEGQNLLQYKYLAKAVSKYQRITTLN